MPDDLEARARNALGEPVGIDDPLIDPRSLTPEVRAGIWTPAILGILVVFAVLFYYNAWRPNPVNVASNIVKTTTEKVIPPAMPVPMSQPTQAQPEMQPQ
jgi:hypothetical protein